MPLAWSLQESQLTELCSEAAFLSFKMGNGLARLLLSFAGPSEESWERMCSKRAVFYPAPGTCYSKCLMCDRYLLLFSYMDEYVRLTLEENTFLSDKKSICSPARKPGLVMLWQLFE